MALDKIMLTPMERKKVIAIQATIDRLLAKAEQRGDNETASDLDSVSASLENLIQKFSDPSVSIRKF